MGEFGKKFPASEYAQEKNSCTRPSSQKKFMHVQWAGKKILADVPCADTVNFCINKLLTDNNNNNNNHSLILVVRKFHLHRIKCA